MCICETFLRNDDKPHIQGFEWFGNNRKNISKRAIRGSGGVGILVKTSVLHTYSIAVVEEKFEGILWIQLIHKHTKAITGICVCYLPPPNSSRGDHSQEFFDTLKSLIIDNGHLGDLMICGDFNARCGNLSDSFDSIVLPKRKIIDATSNSTGRQFIELLKTLDMCVLNGRFDPVKDNYTSVSTKGLAVVDYCVVPVHAFSQFSNFTVHDTLHLVNSCKIPIDSKVPDHRPISWSYELKTNLIQTNATKAQLTTTRMPQDYFSSDQVISELLNLTNHLNDLTHNKEEVNDEVNKVYSTFCTIIDDQLQHKRIPSKKNTSRTKPWWDAGLSALAREVESSLKAWELNTMDNSLKQVYVAKQKAFSKAIRRSKRQFRRKRQLEFLHQQKYKARTFWRRFKSLTENHVKDKLPEMVIDPQAPGKEVCEPSEVLKVWEHYFHNLLNITSDSLVSDCVNSLPNPPSCDSLNDPISLEEVESAVYANPTSKAAGFDKIRANYIKNAPCVSFLHTFFNFCLQSGCTPTAWGRAIIKPIPKTNRPTKKPNDYRGISLQPVIAKTYCRILNNRLKMWAEVNDILSDEQNGFRPGRSCQDHIFTLMSIIENRFQQKKDTFACFIDFRKAFDSVNRSLLWNKICNRYGISGPFLDSLKAIYRDVKCRVNINNQLTDWFDVDNGVKQGCLLSPTLFALFIDDLVSELNKHVGLVCGSRLLSALLYADDIVLLAPSPKDLQRQIDVVTAWCLKWGIKINVTKTNVIHFHKETKNKQRSNFCFHTNGVPIEYVAEYRYLGFYINEHLDLAKSVDRVVNSANRALALLNHRTRIAGGFHYETYSTLFSQLVQSIILTNACIWGHKECGKVYTIQKRAMRFFLGVGISCPNAGIFGELGWIPIRAHIRESILKFRRRLLSMDDSRLTHQIFAWSLSLSSQGKSNWAARTESLMNKLNLSDNSIMDLNYTWEAIANAELTEWNEQLQQTPPGSESGGRLANYRTFKTVPQAEDYIIRSMSLDKRRTIAQLRCGCLPLEIELGRYRNPKIPLDQRICNLCNTGTEDETHFLTTCPALTDARSPLYLEMAKLDPSFTMLTRGEQTKKILQSCATNHTIGNLVYELSRLRRNFLQ